MFRKKSKEQELKKTLTILDSETQEVKETYEIVDEAKEITLNDEKGSKYSETQLKDMSFMGGLRDAYPNMKDMETFLMDACKSRKLIKDEELTDEQKEEQAKLNKIAESDAKTAKLLKDKALDEKNQANARQLEIEEAERKRHAAAQSN